MRNASITTTLIVICVLLLAATAVAQEVKQEPLKFQQLLTSDGDVLYAELCAVCHGALGKGDGPAAKALVTKVPDLTTLAVENEFPAKQVEKSIRGEARTVAAHGSLEMPIWGHAFSEVRPDWGDTRSRSFANLRIKNLVKHIESLQAPATQDEATKDE